MLTYKDERTQGGGGGGQGQPSGNQGGGFLKRAANKSRGNKAKRQWGIHTQGVAKAVVDNLVVVGEEYKGLDGADANGWMG